MSNFLSLSRFSSVDSKISRYIIAGVASQFIKAAKHGRPQNVRCQSTELDNSLFRNFQLRFDLNGQPYEFSTRFEAPTKNGYGFRLTRHSVGTKLPVAEIDYDCSSCPEMPYIISAKGYLNRRIAVGPSRIKQRQGLCSASIIDLPAGHRLANHVQKASNAMLSRLIPHLTAIQQKFFETLIKPVEL